MLKGKVVLRFRFLFLTLVFLEPAIRQAHLAQLHGNNEVGVVGLVDAYGREGNASQSLVDKAVLHVVTFGHTHVDAAHRPPGGLQLLNHCHIKAFVGGGIRCTLFGSGIVEIHHIAAHGTFGCIVARKVLNEFAQFALVLHIERFNHIESHYSIALIFLPHHKGIDVGIVVECNVEGFAHVAVGVHAAIVALAQFLKVGLIALARDAFSVHNARCLLGGEIGLT